MTVFSLQNCSKSQLTRIIKDKALELGYADVGVTSADPFEGYREEMESRPGYDRWFTMPTGPYAGADPKDVMPELKSIICTVFDFSKTAYPEELTRSIGRAYLGRGYLPNEGSVNGFRHASFIAFLRELGIQVDESGPYRVPDRYAAARAGLVTYGGNNLAYAEDCGSLVIISSFLVDVDLDYDVPSVKRPCPPDCSKCVKACPTGALYEPGKLNYTKCMLARQINPAPIEEEMREQMGLSIHGCDRCQEACPRNEPVLAKATRKDPFLERLRQEFDLEKVLLLDDAYYERVVYPVMYNYITVPWLFQRNAAIALGNTLDPVHLPVLRRAKEACPEEVQEYIDWAIMRIQGEGASA